MNSNTIQLLANPSGIVNRELHPIFRIFGCYHIIIHE